MMNEINIPFQHHQSAHCESGVTSNLLYHYGLKVSEPLAFGIGSGLFFAHIPFIKVNGIPLQPIGSGLDKFLKNA
jgi:hypothetical protein